MTRSFSSKVSKSFMALKNQYAKEDPPAASSLEEVSTDEEYSTEEEEEKTLQSPPPPPPPKTKSNPKSQSTADKPESDSESGTESDSEAEPDNEPTKVVAKKPSQEISKKRSLESLVTVAVPSPMVEVKNSKRAKKVESNAIGEKSEDQKKQLFQRLFSEDDEVSLLEGLIEFNSKYGFNPSKDMNAFHEFIKKSVHFDVSVSQLKDKIDRLRKKFRNNVNKGRASSSFTSPHEQKMFNLSNRLWGSEATANVAESSAKSHGKAKSARENGKKVVALKCDMEMDDVKEEDAEKGVVMEIDSDQKAVDLTAIVAGKFEDFVLSTGLDMMPEAKRAEMEEKWREYKIAALELFIRKNELLNKQAKYMLDAYKSMND